MLSASDSTVRHLGHGSSKTQLAVKDLREGLLRWHLWCTLGWLDVKQRYRRAVIGPFWITISMSVFVGMLGVLYAGIFAQDVRVFLPYIAAGFLVWQFFSATISEATTTFIAAEGIIRMGGLPLSFSIFRLLYRNVVIYAHNFIVMIVIYLWQPQLLGSNILFLVPATLLVLLNIGWMSLIIAIFCTRFRDLPPIIVSLLQILLFISPIMYMRSSVPPHLSFLVDFNPLHYIVDIMRRPLLNTEPLLSSYFVLTVLAIVGWVMAFLLFRWLRARIAYWI
jgi:ABC-type polysaccharide/polyol phosphate export permease